MPVTIQPATLRYKNGDGQFQTADCIKGDIGDPSIIIDDTSGSGNTGKVWSADKVSSELDGKLDSTLKGAANGIAELDQTGKVPSSQLPSYVDDVLEYASLASFPQEGESGKIYVSLDTNKTYRWGGSAYAEISESLALGETSTTAYRGDRGKVAYEHATDSGKIANAQVAGLYKIAVTAEGHIASVSAVTASDIIALGIIDDTAGDGDTNKVWSADKSADLMSAISNRVEKAGQDQVTAKNLTILEKTYAPNLYNTETVTTGIYLNPASGAENENSGYLTTDYIPVEAGEQYYGTWCWSTDLTRRDMSLNWVTCYDSEKSVVGSAGMTSATNPITIPTGVAYIRISHSANTYYANRQFEKGSTPTPYYAYGTLLSSRISSEYLPETDMSTIPAFQAVDGQNLIDKTDSDFVTGKFLDTGGNLSDNSGYNTTGFIAVKPGDYLVSSYLPTGGSTAAAAMRTVACYDSTKAVLGTKGKYSTYSFVVPSGVSYIRACFANGSYGLNLQIQKVGIFESYSPYVEYEDPHYEIKSTAMPSCPGKPEHAYLPPDIYVAVGRTIELYNEQIVLDHGKYHFRWICSKGNAYARKFSITGETTGNVNLTLELYDDHENLCWIGRSVVHVVAASNPTVKILPIGDSLTRGKVWLPEMMLLSSSNITWLGTRYSGVLEDSEGNQYASGSIHHEGRSGWSAGSYNANSTYTEDNNYDGVPGVSGSSNPFWDGTKFSLEHYLTTQTGIDAPDAVQIFLGTNDLTVSVESAVENIVSMVTSIRSEYVNLPVFVCNTIFRSNQNGYGSTGSEAYAGGSGAGNWQYEQDAKVMDLMIGLRERLASVSGVTFIPLASCMDREYDFGQVMTKVNPRSTVEIPMPSESVHPQDVGYYQIADLMYSTYCGVLGS